MKRTRKSQPATAGTTSLATFLAGSNFLAVNKTLMKQHGPLMAVYISNLADKFLYFQRRNMLQDDGSFFLTHEQQMEQTGMGIDQLRRCKSHLIKAGVLSVSKRGVPAKEYYKIDFSFVGKLNNFTHLSEVKTSGNQRSRPRETRGLYKDNKDNNTKLRDYIPYAGNGMDGQEQSKSSSIKTKVATSAKTAKKGNGPRKASQFLPHARKLATFVRREHRVKVNDWSISEWSSEISVLAKSLEGDDVPDRIDRALDWYIDHWEDKGVPEIRHGRTLRLKFLSLESAMRRAGEDVDRKRPGRSADEITSRYFRDNKVLVRRFSEGPMKTAARLVEADKRDLTRALLDVVDYVDVEQEDLSDALRKALPGRMEVLEEFISWLGRQSWMNHKTLGMFDPGGKLFARFRSEASRLEGRDALTGQVLEG